MKKTLLNSLNKSTSFKNTVSLCKQAKLKLLGTGTSRKVFAINKKHALKIAYNKAGVAQNLAEAQNSKKNHRIVAKVLNHCENYRWLLVERAYTEEHLFDKREDFYNGRESTFLFDLDIYEVETGFVYRGSRKYFVAIDYGLNKQSVMFY